MFNNLNRKIILIFLLFFNLLCLVLTPGQNVFATEGGGGAYPNGAEDFMTGSIPPPGTYLINYFSYYHADKRKDNNGNTVPGDFNAESTADTLRFIHITKQKIFGASWGMHTLIPFVNLHIRTPGGVDSKAGLGDITVNPLLLGWHLTNWHFAAGVDTKIPTGSYNKKDIANIGRNYWTFEPIFAVTYLSSNGYEVSSKFMYDFNTKNTATNYWSGEEFHFDYTLGKKIENMNIGIGGYYYKQITDDSLNGNVLYGKKGQVFAFGPQFKYGLKNMYFTLKYQWETLVKNRPEGEKFWFKFGYTF